MYNNKNINSLENIEQNETNVFLDVRTQTEFAGGHIDGAINIDVMSADFGAKIESLKKTNNYYVMCRSGGRSASACSTMANAGFTTLTNMEGGMMGWMGNVFSV